MSLFDEFLSVAAEDIKFGLRGHTTAEWLDFLLNPRRLRGSDFLMRWSQGVWSEERVMQAVNDTDDFFAIPYGPSGAAPHHDIRAFEDYFEALEKAGLGKNKRPDLLVFKKSSREKVDALVCRLGGTEKLPFTPEDNDKMRELLNEAILAVECENSLWIVRRMPDYGKPLDDLKKKKKATVPTVILKEEDRVLLQIWQNGNRVPIHIWHVFYDIAFGIPFDKAQKLIEGGDVPPTEQIFYAPSGSTTRKTVYKICYHYAYCLGEVTQEPELKAEFIVDKNGHILPYVRFSGGKVILCKEALEMLRNIATAKGF
ncbi:MAG: AccI family restriction endonuclease [Thermoflexales bacterium]|nr:AccI family restriction endonuclease [Thermoflexales bacterium]